MSRQKTTKSGRRALKLAQPIVEAAGGTCWLEDPPGTGHQRLIVELGGRTRFTPVAGSPRDMDVMLKHKLIDVKRLLEELRA